MGSSGMISDSKTHPQAGMVRDDGIMNKEEEGFQAMATKRVNCIIGSITGLTNYIGMPPNAEPVLEKTGGNCYLGYPIGALSRSLEVLDIMSERFQHYHGIEIKAVELAPVASGNRIIEFYDLAEKLYKSVHVFRELISGELIKLGIAIPTRERETEDVLDFILVCLDDIKAMLKKF